MDLFALILVSITAVTICGICLFIFVCAFQPQFLRKLHGYRMRNYDDSESNATSNENDDRSSAKSLEINNESTDLTNGNSIEANGRDKKAYLKSVERSLRTGRRIQDEKPNNENRSHPIRRFFNKYILRREPYGDEHTES